MKYKRKYNLGVQEIMVPEKGGIGDMAGSVLGTAGAGTRIGSIFGPAGTIAGGLIGGAIGATKAVIDKGILERERENAIAHNNYIQEHQRSQDPHLQMYQAEHGLDISSSKPVEVERNELVFERNKAGKYTLKADFKGGKTHDKGGEDYMAKEGDVIFPGKLRDKVMKHYKSKNFPGLESIRLTLPKDTPVAEDGLDLVDDTLLPKVNAPDFNVGTIPSAGYQGYSTDSYLPKVDAPAFNLDSIPNPNYGNYMTARGGIGDYTEPNYISNSSSLTVPVERLGSNGVVPNVNFNRGIQSAPTIYNTLQGVFGKVAKPTRRFVHSDKYRYTDTSAPLMQASNEAMAVDMANANRTLGSRGQALSYMSQAGVGNFNRKYKIIGDEVAKKTSIDNMNTQLANSDKLTNLQLANQYDTEYLQNKAKKTEYLGKGLEGVSGLSFNDELMGNMKDRDKLLTSMAKTRNYGYEEGVGIGYYTPDGNFISGGKTYKTTTTKYKYR
jgi:hypothetical protein